MHGQNNAETRENLEVI